MRLGFVVVKESEPTAEAIGPQRRGTKLYSWALVETSAEEPLYRSDRRFATPREAHNAAQAFKEAVGSALIDKNPIDEDRLLP